MASLNPQSGEAKSTVLTLLRKVYQQRPRMQKARLVAFSAIGLFVFLLMLSQSSWQAQPDLWNEFPSRHPFPQRPEEAQVVLPQQSNITINDALPHDLEKSNPKLHVLLTAHQGTRGTCRAITSAMILGYPAPTLIGYGDESSSATEFERIVNRIKRTRNYLKQSKVVKDGDIILLVDGEDVFFQLPPHVLLKRYQNLLRNHNQKLLKKYGMAVVESPAPGSPHKLVEKYTQRVLFGARKKCYSGLEGDAGCISIPQSSLPPDVYGWKTDSYADGHLNRPRWLDPGVVIGQAADLRLIYDEALQLLEQRHEKLDQGHALTHLFGRQEAVRELERRRTASAGKEWLYRLLGISDAGNLTGVKLRLERGHRYEYGVGVDYESQLFFSQFMSRNDVEWIKYDNYTKTAAFQGEHGVPRESRLLLPADIAALSNPFNQSRFARDTTMLPRWNATLDKLPNPHERSWDNIPLMTNPHSASVPVLVHLNGDPKLRNSWWEQMWFFPWARALLRKYIRDSRGFDAAQSALLGGQEWWDMRGGRGGVWTEDESWLTLSEVCEGQERELFDDGLGPWAKENGDPDKPRYNRFGNLIYGKQNDYFVYPDFD